LEPTPAAEALNEALQGTLDNLDKAATTIRKMLRRAKTREEAQALAKKLADVHGIIQDVALVRFEDLANSARVRKITEDLDKATEEVRETRLKITTAANAIEFASKIIDIATKAIGKATPLV
jgi:methylphosphotriester-DNA--protein-cysteine methyltransferase